jgi:hypothetical protein
VTIKAGLVNRAFSTINAILSIHPVGGSSYNISLALSSAEEFFQVRGHWRLILQSFRSIQQSITSRLSWGLASLYLGRLKSSGHKLINIDHTHLSLNMNTSCILGSHRLVKPRAEKSIITYSQRYCPAQRTSCLLWTSTSPRSSTIQRTFTNFLSSTHLSRS